MANSYLNRTVSSAGNRRTFTLSAWVKRSKLGYDYAYMVTAGQYSSDQMAQFKFDSNDQLNISGYASNGNKDFRVHTNRVFRDVNAWYHVMAAVDTTQSTAADRVKVYVNGVQETSFAEATYPSQNYDTAFNSTVDSLVGLRKGTSTYFEGYMSHVAIVDGAALAPTVFGETDSTSGIWKFKSPSGVTWGTNGVHLKFENSGALGTDSSGNTNTYTVNGNLKQALDTPSNVYATFNSLYKPNLTVTFSNANTSWTNSGSNGWHNVGATLGASTGKWYWELKNISNQAIKVGVIDPVVNMSASNTQDLTNGVTYFDNQGSGSVTVDGSNSGSYGTFNNTDVMGVAVDMTSSTKAFSIYKNGTALFTDLAISTNIETAIPFFSYYGGSATFNVNFGNGFFGTTAITSAGSNGNGSLFEYDVPSGYYALNTKNINTYG